MTEKILVNICTYATLKDNIYILYRILGTIIFYCIALYHTTRCTNRRQPRLFNSMFALLCSWTTSLQTSKGNTRFREPDSYRLL